MSPQLLYEATYAIEFICEIGPFETQPYDGNGFALGGLPTIL